MKSKKLNLRSKPNSKIIFNGKGGGGKVEVEEPGSDSLTGLPIAEPQRGLGGVIHSFGSVDSLLVFQAPLNGGQPWGMAMLYLADEFITEVVKQQNKLML